MVKTNGYNIEIYENTFTVTQSGKEITKTLGEEVIFDHTLQNSSIEN